MTNCATILSKICIFQENYPMSLERIAHRLGKPFFHASNFSIYQIDCLEALPHLTNECIDLTVTSPPYNIGKEYENILPTHQYIEWCKFWIQEIYRVTADKGAFWLNLGYISLPDKAKAVPLPYLLWEHIPFFLVQEIVWNYSAGVACTKSFSPRNEKFLWYVKDSSNYTFNLDEVRDPNVKYPNQKKNGKIKVNPKGKNPTDVWQFPKVTSGKNRASRERTPHPAQFPISVIERIVKACSHPNDTILDPFLGSGTTAISALSLGRKFVGFEIRDDYCEIAASRIENLLTAGKVHNNDRDRQRQLSLFLCD